MQISRLLWRALETVVWDATPSATKQLWINHVITYNFTLPSSWLLPLPKHALCEDFIGLHCCPPRHRVLLARPLKVQIAWSSHSNMFCFAQRYLVPKNEQCFFSFYFQLLDTDGITSLLWLRHFSLCSWVGSLQLCTTVLFILSIISDWLELCVCVSVCVLASLALAASLKTQEPWSWGSGTSTA